MSLAGLTEPKRITLSLDPGLVLERMILQRVSGLKRRRGQDWLRSLLVQGFLAESRWIRSERQREPDQWVPRGTPMPAAPFADWLGHAQSRNGARADAAPQVAVATTSIPDAKADAKPFAHLRKVIG